MKFLLNKEKSSLLMIGQTVFTFDDPGPKDIDLDKVGESIVRQLIYNCRRGLLACGDPHVLLAREAPPAKIPVSTDHERPVPKDTPINGSDSLEEDLKPLKKLLKARIATIRKELAKLPPGRVRKLRDLEVAGKNRKGLLEDMDLVIQKHIDAARAAVGEIDVGGKTHAPGVTSSPNVSDIVESDVREVQVDTPNSKNRAWDIAEQT